MHPYAASATPRELAAIAVADPNLQRPRGTDERVLVQEGVQIEAILVSSS
jgi:hypothetical protein